MHPSDGRYLRDAVTWAVVIGCHVLLLTCLARIERQPVAGRESGIELFFVAPPPEKPPTGKVAPRHSAAVERRRDVPVSGTSITLPAETPANRIIDWYGEAESVARGMAEKGAQPGPRAFGEQPKSPYRKCAPRQSSFEWDPEPDKFGIAGLLPFVRLGERCIAGLGFFGCGIGKLPEANGKLFDDMNDPDRPKSSVPDVEECRP